MANTKKRTFIDLLILALVLLTGLIAVNNATAIGDWWHFLSYKPPNDIAILAEKSGMSTQGSRLFYRFSPQFVDTSTIKQECLEHALGCSVGQNIYILKASTSQERNRSAVTAAHEMLHIAYSRLSEDDITLVKDLVDNELANSKHPDVTKQLEPFSGDTYYNEAHSYIGSSAATISNDFEDYYNQYFSDRSKVINAFKNSPER